MTHVGRSDQEQPPDLGGPASHGLDQIKQAGASEPSYRLFMAFRYFVGLAGEKVLFRSHGQNPTNCRADARHIVAPAHGRQGSCEVSRPRHGNWAGSSREECAW